MSISITGRGFHKVDFEPGKTIAFYAAKYLGCNETDVLSCLGNDNQTMRVDGVAVTEETVNNVMADGQVISVVGTTVNDGGLKGAFVVRS